MGKFNLDPNESINFQCDQISNGNFSLFIGELILTDKNIIYVSKNMFGGIKKVQKYPLNSVKEHNGTAHVVVEKKNNVYHTLTIYFKNGMEIFGFPNKDANEAKRMANSINRIVTGSPTDLYSQKYSSIPGATLAAETLKGTFDAFKDVFGVKGRDLNVETISKIAKKCSACSAPISGYKNQIVKCDYCDTDQQL